MLQLKFKASRKGEINFKSNMTLIFLLLFTITSYEDVYGCKSTSNEEQKGNDDQTGFKILLLRYIMY